MNILGVSAKYLQQLQAWNVKQAWDLSSLRQIYSTGSPLCYDDFAYVAKLLAPGVPLISITGGTDIISLFAGGCPMMPVEWGEIQCRCLGMAVEAYDEQVKPVRDAPGELVCLKPFPSMPIGFWDDADCSVYRAAYFERYPGIWHHGDFIQINSQTGGILMLGRSDGTLNPAGVRFGSAELYRIVLSAQFPEIEDALAVGVRRPTDADERVILFLKLKSNLTEELKTNLIAAIRTELSPRHLPAAIIAAPDIPYTLNGKRIEVAVKRLLSGMGEPTNLGAVANPDSFDFYRQLQLPF